VLLRIWPSPEQCIDKRGHRLSSETAFEATQEECKEWKAFILSSTQPTIDMEPLADSKMSCIGTYRIL
jgi:hypothetical protein